MNRPALFFLALILASCAAQPTPAPVLVMTRLDAKQVVVEVRPAMPGTWTLHPSQECGAPDGPGITGILPASGVLILLGTRGDLFTVTADGTSASAYSLADCLPV